VIGDPVTHFELHLRFPRRRTRTRSRASVFKRSSSNMRYPPIADALIDRRPGPIAPRPFDRS
jgi:hypothetical protein